MSCLFCKHFEAIEPAEHRDEREARTCEFSCGNRWNAYTAARYVKCHKRFLVGFCHLNPKPEAVRCEGVCAKIELAFNANWVTPPKADEHLWDWARTAMQEHIHGDYREQERDRLSEENKKLKAALKASRERSASRLAKLSKLTKKEKDEPKPAPVLRLVAAE